MSLNNLPPFYIGQKVVYITGHMMKKDSIHIITGIKQRKCGCWTISINNDVSNDSPLFHCDIHISMGNWMNDGICWSSKSFRALKEQSFPLLTYSKVLEEVGVSAN